jgi:chemotaxis protein methyltransferase CheR
VTEATLGEADSARFRDLIQRTSGIELGEVRRADLERAVLRTVERTALSGPAELYTHLSTDGHTVDLETFVAELTIGETYFFRHRAQFEVLERHILPELIARRADERRLRVWSAGCATGEEPYSLAILLDRLLPDRDSWNVMILGTDINRGALERAQRGCYRPWSFRGVDALTQARSFSRSGEDLRIDPAIARMVTFSYLNLVEDAYPSLATNTQSMDLILCRNVLIYFGDRTIEGVLGRLHDSLCEGGWLVSGPADTSAEGYRTFEARSFPDAIVYRRPARSEHRPAAVPPPPALRPPAPPAPRAVRPPPASQPAPAPVPRPERPATATGPLPEVVQAFARWRAGAVDEAADRLAELDAAGASDPWPGYLLAKICANERRLDEALEWADRALMRDPVFGPAHYLRGLVLGERGDLRGATDAIRRCVFLDPEFVVGQYALAGFLARLGETERAIKAIESVIRAAGELERESDVPEGDGLTAGRLMELAAVQRGLLLSEEHDAEDGARVHA